LNASAVGNDTASFNGIHLTSALSPDSHSHVRNRNETLKHR
jgi:hypothetical protein